MVTLTVNILGLIMAMVALALCVGYTAHNNGCDIDETAATMFLTIAAMVVGYIFGCGVWSVL